MGQLGPRADQILHLRREPSEACQSLAKGPQKMRKNRQNRIVVQFEADFIRKVRQISISFTTFLDQFFTLFHVVKSI